MCNDFVFQNVQIVFFLLFLRFCVFIIWQYTTACFVIAEKKTRITIFYYAQFGNINIRA